MKLDQIKFLWTMKNVHPEGDVIQDSTSIIRVNLRKQIQVTHDYKKGNRVEITFLTDGARYVVEDHNQLQDVCLIHLQNKVCEQKMRKFCDEHFQKVN